MIIEDDQDKEALVFQAGVNELIASAWAVNEAEKDQSRFSDWLYDGLRSNLSLLLCARRYDRFSQSK